MTKKKTLWSSHAVGKFTAVANPVKCSAPCELEFKILYTYGDWAQGLGTLLLKLEFALRC